MGSANSRSGTLEQYIEGIVLRVMRETFQSTSTSNQSDLISFSEAPVSKYKKSRIGTAKGRVTNTSDKRLKKNRELNA